MLLSQSIPPEGMMLTISPFQPVSPLNIRIRPKAARKYVPILQTKKVSSPAAADNNMSRFVVICMPAAPKICTRCMNTYHAAHTDTASVTTPTNCCTTPRANASPAVNAMKPTIAMVAHMLEGTFWACWSTSLGWIESESMEIVRTS